MAESPPSLPRVSSLQSSSEVEAELESLRSAIRNVQEQNNELASDRALADREVRRLRKEADLLRRELNAVREADPRSVLIREVLDHWVKALGRSSRTKCPPNGARWNKVRARLNDGFTVDQLKQAIEGCAKVPFVGPKGRQPQEANGAKRHDDIELICRDETTVERFIGYAKVEQPKPVPAPRRRFQEYGRRPIDRLLEALPGEWRAGVNPDCWMAQCPAHDDHDPSLSIRVEGSMDGEVVLVHCFAGCPTDEVLAALGLGMGDLFASGVELHGGGHRRGPLPPHLNEALRGLMDNGRGPS